MTDGVGNVEVLIVLLNLNVFPYILFLMVELHIQGCLYKPYF